MIETMGRCGTAAVPVFDFGQLHTQRLKNGMNGKTVLNGRGVICTTREVRESHPKPHKRKYWSSGAMEYWDNGFFRTQLSFINP
jgi:hypothetical protein